MNDIYTLMDDLEAKLKHIISQHPELETYTFALEFMKPQNILYKETIDDYLRSSNDYSTKNLERLERILQRRYNRIYRTYQCLDKENIEKGIDIITDLYNKIIADFVFQKMKG